jgi:hypothetical protein
LKIMLRQVFMLAKDAETDHACRECSTSVVLLRELLTLSGTASTRSSSPTRARQFKTLFKLNTHSICLCL